MRRASLIHPVALFGIVASLLVILASAAPGDDVPTPVPPPTPPIAVETGVAETAKSLDQAELDKKALDSAKLKATEPEGLLKYLKDRTLTDTELSKIQVVIKLLGNDDFDTRLKATSDLERMGLPAIKPLRLASKDNNYSPEVIYRSESILKRIEKVPHTDVELAAIRALSKVKNPEIVPTLLGFIPLSDNLAILEQIQLTLTASAVVDGKPDPTLVAALESTNPIRRIGAAIAFIEGAPAADKGRLKNLYPKILELAKAETDSGQKFKIIKSLFLNSKEVETVGLLIEMIPEMNRGQIWQTEDLLMQLAGKDTPNAKCLKSKVSLVKAQTAWKEWWKKAEATTDLSKLDLKPRLQGNFLLLMIDNRFGVNGTLTEFGPDLKERWSMNGFGNPSDFAFAKDGRVHTVDYQACTLSERDRSGKVISSKRVELDMAKGGGKIQCNPQSIELLENGNRVVYCRQAVIEYGKDYKQVMSYMRPANPNGNADICAGLRLKNGETILSVQNNGPNGQVPQIITIDAKGELVKDKIVKTGPPNHYSSIIESGADRIILAEQNQFVEYNLKTGKAEGFKRPMNQARCIQKLPSGNFLYIDMNVYPPRVVEVTPEGEEAWAYQTKDQNFSVIKAMVR